MSIKILTANGIDNTNIDGARDAFFNSGMRDGIVKGALNEGTFGLSSSNIFYLDTCELRIAGHRVVIDEALYKTFSNKPSIDTRYSFVAQIVVDDNSGVEFSTFVQSANTTIRKDNLYVSKNGAGTYQVEIGRLTLLTDGTITDIVRTIDVITGNGNVDVDYIRIGEVNTTMLETGLDAEVDVENVVNEETGLKETNFTFSIPKSAGSVVNVGGEQVSTLNFTSDPQVQINDRAKLDASNLTDENVSSFVNKLAYDSNDNERINAVGFAEEERQKSKNLYTVGGVLEKTVSGVAVKFDKEKEQISFNGTATSAFSVGFEIVLNIPLKKGEYTFSITNNGTITGGSYKVLYFYFKNESSYKTISIPTTSGSKGTTTVMLEEDEVLSNISFDISNETTFDNCIFYIQIEEGSVATDYQPYNGAIVHEKEIQNVEHVEVIYDKDSTDANINWGYTNGFKAEWESNGNVTISHSISNFNKYNKLRIYANFGGDYIIFDASKWNNVFRGAGAGFCWALNTTQLQAVDCQISSNELIFRFRYLVSNAILAINNSTYVAVCKIEGVF